MRRPGLPPACPSAMPHANRKDPVKLRVALPAADPPDNPAALREAGRPGSARAASRLSAGVELLHVLGREVPTSDLSGTLRLGTRSALLAELDAQRARLAQARNRALSSRTLARSSWRAASPR